MEKFYNWRHAQKQSYDSLICDRKLEVKKSRHRWTGRYEAHLWDKSTWNQNQNKKGKQGAYDDEEAAARAYDLAALKYWGAGTLINFPLNDYARDLEEMQMVSKEDYLVSLRRKSSAFARGFTKYRAMPRQSQSSRWDAPLSQMIGTEYYNCSTSKDPPTEGKYGNSFGMERKIDLTSHIRWWAPKKSRQPETGAVTRMSAKSSRHLKALSKHPSHISFPCLASKGRRLLEDLLHTASYPSLQPSRASGRKHHKCMMAPVKSQSRGSQLLICFPVVNLIAQGSTWDMVSYQSRDRSSRCLLSSLLRSELHGIRWSPCLILFSGRVLCLHQDNHSQQQFHLCLRILSFK
ncbi:hypothetical protein HPP92_013532 [Vanilla planifolia]|uniref:AP2/ERF domain-containing protein n=1 Tax=Vanilla planifolia TaxID=51239 RepID=A0A835QVS0_VANPL|nr:hypothetical protein HPP92_013532 [Vanilla planifolia]